MIEKPKICYNTPAWERVNKPLANSTAVSFPTDSAPSKSPCFIKGFFVIDNHNPIESLKWLKYRQNCRR